MPGPWDDAFTTVCWTVDGYAARTDKQQAVTDYMNVILDLTPSDADFSPERDKMAAAGKRITANLASLPKFKSELLGLLPFAKLARCLKPLPNSVVQAGMRALKDTATNLTFQAGAKGAKTENQGGNIIISRDIIMSASPLGLAFALAHEFGHAADYTLRQPFPTIHGAITPTLASTTKSQHVLEYFADAFATIYLGVAASNDRKSIPAAAKFLFDDEGESADHPSSSDRVARVNECIQDKC